MAKKPTVTSITSGYASNTQLNANFESIRDAFENTLSRDGSTPNAMTADLDLNSNDIINAASIEADTLTVGGSTFDVASLSGLVSVSSQFLDPKDIDLGGGDPHPTTRDDGSDLQAGDIYFNTSNSTSYIYSGTTWIPIVSSSATVTIDNFSGTGSQVDFTLSVDPSDEKFTFVYVDGEYQQKNTYSISGTTLTFAVAPLNLTDIEVVIYSGQLLTSTDTFNNITVTGGTITGATVSVPQLESTITSGRNLRLTATDSGTPQNYIQFYNQSIPQEMGIIGNTTGTDLLVQNSTSFGFLRLATFGTARLSIAPNGKVGIKQSSPAYDLDVNGDINFTGTLTQNGTTFGGGTGSVLEELHSLCNTTSLKERATIQNVTTHQDLTTTYADVTGSLVSAYTCPEGTSEIVYEFNYQLGASTTSVMTHWRLYFSTDGSSWTEVTKATTGQQGGSYGAFKYPLRWVFKVNAGVGNDDSTVGQFAAARPTLYFKWQAREYDGSYQGRIHGTYYWNGAVANQFSLPSIMIKAIA